MLALDDTLVSPCWSPSRLLYYNLFQQIESFQTPRNSHTQNDYHFFFGSISYSASHSIQTSFFFFKAD